MSKKQNRKKVIFTLTMPKTEIPFAQLSTARCEQTSRASPFAWK